MIKFVLLSFTQVLLRICLLRELLSICCLGAVNYISFWNLIIFYLILDVVHVEDSSRLVLYIFKFIRWTSPLLFLPTILDILNAPLQVLQPRLSLTRLIKQSFPRLRRRLFQCLLCGRVIFLHFINLTLHTCLYSLEFFCGFSALNSYFLQVLEDAILRKSLWVPFFGSRIGLLCWEALQILQAFLTLGVG